MVSSLYFLPTIHSICLTKTDLFDLWDSISVFCSPQLVLNSAYHIPSIITLIMQLDWHSSLNMDCLALAYLLGESAQISFVKLKPPVYCVAIFFGMRSEMLFAMPQVNSINPSKKSTYSKKPSYFEKSSDFGKQFTAYSKDFGKSSTTHLHSLPTYFEKSKDFEKSITTHFKSLTTCFEKLTDFGKSFTTR